MRGCEFTNLCILCDDIIVEQHCTKIITSFDDSNASPTLPHVPDVLMFKLSKVPFVLCARDVK
jgi:hypothetical protein